MEPVSGLAAMLSGGAGSGSVTGAGSAWGAAGQLAAQLTGPPAGELMMPGYWRVG